jgi:hypothetical protein
MRWTAWRVLGFDRAPGGDEVFRQLDLAAAGDAVADLADRPDQVVQRQVRHDRPAFDHRQHQVGGPELEQRGGLAHVLCT